MSAQHRHRLIVPVHHTSAAAALTAPVMHADKGAMALHWLQVYYYCMTVGVALREYGLRLAADLCIHGSSPPLPPCRAPLPCFRFTPSGWWW
jgi:hypothetical protein